MPKETNCKCPRYCVVGVEYSYDHPAHYDGISEWRCTKCGERVGRWSGKRLAGKRFEWPFGRRRVRRKIDGISTVAEITTMEDKHVGS
jgi:hypothetical protein